MTRSLPILCFVLALLLGAPRPSPAQEAGGNVPVPEDLLAVLKLRGQRCAGIASYQRLGESDYLVVCSDGPRYRIYVSGEERIVVEER